MESADVREQVAAASRRLAAEGLVLGTAGNVSARTGDHVAITPTGAELATLEADDVTVIALNGTVVAGSLAPTSEIDLHLGVYRRYDAGAVVHTHAPMATALACVLEDELPCVHYTMLALGGSVRVAPYRTFGTPELAQVVLDALEGKTAALMASHGAIAYAADVGKAVDASLLLEWACDVYWRAAQVGTPRAMSADEQQAVVAAAIERSYGTTQRLEEHVSDDRGAAACQQHGKVREAAKGEQPK
jgi:L-fuculose-phosphate aldolase